EGVRAATLTRARRADRRASAESLSPPVRLRRWRAHGQGRPRGSCGNIGATYPTSGANRSPSTIDAAIALICVTVCSSCRCAPGVVCSPVREQCYWCGTRNWCGSATCSFVVQFGHSGYQLRSRRTRVFEPIGETRALLQRHLVVRWSMHLQLVLKHLLVRN